MNAEDRLRLFLYNSAIVQREVLTISESDRRVRHLTESGDFGSEIKPYLSQFTHENRSNAASMATWYMLFYMLENDIRGFIRDILVEKGGEGWWDTCVPEPVKREVDQNRTREQDFALQPRSDDPLDYTTFGQLGDIIRENWDVFGGVLSSQKAVGRVLATLNALRGPIAHCGILAADEIDRLKLSIKDWFRVLAGPQ